MVKVKFGPFNIYFRVIGLSSVCVGVFETYHYISWLFQKQNENFHSFHSTYSTTLSIHFNIGSKSTHTLKIFKRLFSLRSPGHATPIYSKRLFFFLPKNIIIIIIIIWTSIIWMNIFFLYRKKWNFSNFTTTNKQTILLLAQRPSSTSLLDQFATRKKPTEFWSKKFFVFCPFFSHQFRSMSKWHTYKQFDFTLNECLDTQTHIHNQSNNNVIFIHP